MRIPGEVSHQVANPNLRIRGVTPPRAVAPRPIWTRVRVGPCSAADDATGLNHLAPARLAIAESLPDVPHSELRAHAVALLADERAPVGVDGLFVDRLEEPGRAAGCLRHCDASGVHTARIEVEAGVPRARRACGWRGEFRRRESLRRGRRGVVRVGKRHGPCFTFLRAKFVGVEHSNDEAIRPGA
jgi:hypothetical protein